MSPTKVQRMSRAEEKREYAFMDPISRDDITWIESTRNDYQA